jgi:hypothetical protein
MDAAKLDEDQYRIWRPSTFSQITDAFLLFLALAMLFNRWIRLTNAMRYCVVDIPVHRFVRVINTLVIYMACPGNSLFPFWKTWLPTFRLSCDPNTNAIDCHESVPMLTFLIDNYDQPRARKYIFIHAHETSWHYRRPVFDQIHQVIASDYFRQTPYGAIFPIYNRGKGGAMSPSMYRYIYQNTSMPRHIIEKENFRPCCATFFVDSELVRTRAKKEYETIRSSLRQWSRENSRPGGHDPAFYCGRVMEYTWHILLSNKSNIPPLPWGGDSSMT